MAHHEHVATHEKTERRGMSFPIPRPRGQDTAPAKAPRKTNHSKAPKVGKAHLLLDSNGRQTVSLERRPSGITIENREQSAASLAKRQRISKAGA